MNELTAQGVGPSIVPVAAVFHGPNRPWTFEPVPDDDFPDHAQVDVKTCTICSSDVHTFTGRRVSPTPCVLGHEAIGHVSRLPESWDLKDIDGRPVAVGDRIVWGVAAHCGRCLYCLDGVPQKCVSLVKYGHGVHRPECLPQGGLSQHIGLSKGTPVVVLDETMDARIACLAACAGATVAATFRLAGGIARRHVVIFGGGVLGCIACSMSRHAGAERIVCVEPDAERRRRALRFGATEAIDSADESLIERIRTLCHEGLGADVCVELSGSNQACLAALGSLRIGGTLILAGAVFPAGSVEIAPEDIIRRMLTIRGLHNYAPDDLGTATAFLSAASQQHPSLWNELFGETFELDQIEKAFEWAVKHPGLRAVVAVSN